MSRPVATLPRLRCIVRSAVLLSITLLNGCGQRDFEIAEVHGRVTRGGKPAQGLTVTFQPVAKDAQSPNPGPASYGFTDADGRYELRTIVGDLRGAVVGQHRVTIRLVKKESTSDAADRVVDTSVPRKFRDGSITQEVPTIGLPAADFDLPPP
jgi:hypothetical protein